MRTRTRAEVKIARLADSEYVVRKMHLQKLKEDPDYEYLSKKLDDLTTFQLERLILEKIQKMKEAKAQAEK